jgi:hypothetical protein
VVEVEDLTAASADLAEDSEADLAEDSEEAPAAEAAPAEVFKVRFIMARIIEIPQDIFAEITEDFQKAFGSDLLSVILYGSGAGSHYIPGKSDLNFMIVLKDAGLNDLERGIPIVTRWQKKRVTFIFMTIDFIRSSSDSYPVEFLDMKLHNILVFGEDVLADLRLEPCHLRLQMERELKGKIFHLQHGFLETEGREKGLRELIRLSLGTFIPLFKALLFLKGYEIPHSRREVVKALSSAFPIEAGIFLKCIDIREGIGKYPAGEIKNLFKSYYGEIARLSALIDAMEV